MPVLVSEVGLTTLWHQTAVSRFMQAFSSSCRFHNFVHIFWDDHSFQLTRVRYYSLPTELAVHE